MNKLKKKQTIKIPKNIKIFYCNKKKIIILKGLNGEKLLKIDKFLNVYFEKQTIQIIIKKNIKLSNIQKKKIGMIQNTTISLLKQLLVESTAFIYQKLKLIGVGYRVFPVDNFENSILLLTLGYSHPIYFKIPFETKIVTLKLTKLFLYGSSYQQLTTAAAKIRLNKIPEPYKGKGILYEHEKIKLKEGKKI